MLTGNDSGAPAISVITATLNAARVLPGLVASLDAQSSRDFEWIVMDGGSTDGTPEMLRKLSLTRPWIRFFSEQDFGLYDALNKAIRRAGAPFYVVIGADDRFAADALANFRRHTADGNVDVLVADVMIDGRRCGGYFPNKAWVGSSRMFSGSHSVGTAIRTVLHARFGYYSARFPLLADGLFLKTVAASPDVRIRHADFIAGEFAKGGMTTTNKIQILAETWQIQLLTERRPVFQTLLFLAKLACRMPGVVAETRRRRRSA